MYDFIIKNGNVIDKGECTKRDIFVRKGRIVDPDLGGEEKATEIFDASGKYVVPGLIDAHLHLNYDGSNGAHADIICPSSGVTTAVDGGSTGWQNYPLFAKSNALRYVTSVYSFLHVSPQGVLDGLATETHNPEDFDEEEILRTIASDHACILGLKIRMDARTLGDFGIRPLERAVEIANRANELGYRCIINAHCTNLPANLDISDVMACLRPGDILVHAFQCRGQTLFAADDTVLASAHEARKRGVVFDCCTGRIHWSFETFRKALADGFPPDIISSDIVRESCFVKPGFSIVHAMCAWLAVGMNELDIFRAVTDIPAAKLGLSDEVGALEAGRTADIAIFDIVEQPINMFDRFGGKLKGDRVFLPLMTFKKGEIVFRQIYF